VVEDIPDRELIGQEGNRLRLLAAAAMSSDARCDLHGLRPAGRPNQHAVSIRDGLVLLGDLPEALGHVIE
jgi:hypothetical protein